jgi:hypothetical protein
MTLFQKRLECRVCETRMTVTLARSHHDIHREVGDTEACVFCPVCDSTVSFDIQPGLDPSTTHIRYFEFDPEALKRRTRGVTSGQ